MTVIKRKLIEVALPLEAINRESAREKSIRHGHPSTIHLWWARRPLAACRAVLFAQLVDDPSSDPDRFPTEAAQASERLRLFDLIERLVVWENGTDEMLFREANKEILNSTGGRPPAILDPFAGGGSIPLEAQRLGLESRASDLNPVAVLINKALIEIPSSWAGLPPVYPGAAADRMSWPNATGLADDVRRYGQWIRDAAEKRVGHLYPKATLADGTEATVIAWIWARTVTCPNPACGIRMPLVRSWWLGKKKGKEAFVVPSVELGPSGQRVVRFAIGHDVNKGPAKSEDGTVTRTGATCISCGSAVPLAYVRAEGKAGRIENQLMAIAAEGDRRRHYLAPTEQHESAADVERPENLLETELPEAALGFRVQGYGMARHSDLFTSRQLVTLDTFAGLIDEARSEVLVDAVAAGMQDDGVSLESGGRLATAYADSIAIYLAFILSKTVDRSSALCTWDSTPANERIRNIFSRQTISMVWDFADSNPFSRSSGNWTDNGIYLGKAIERLGFGDPGRAVTADAATRSYDGVLVSTDPPYYDNVGYADLSDFFYVWLRRSLGRVLPDLMGTVLTPKADELVADPFRRGGADAAETFFEDGFESVFTRIRESTPSDFPITVFYAFKQSDSDSSGTAGTGWQTLLEGMLRSGWAVTATWPMRTELASRMRGQESNALASSIVLALRPRADNAEALNRRSFVSELKSELPSALRDLQLGAIAPVDLAQAAIGPGMAVFSRYSRIVEADGSDMSVRTALALINQVLDEVLADQEGDFDAETRFCVKWFSQFGWNDAPSGEADVLSRAVNTSVGALERGGVFRAAAGKARLLEPSQLSESWDPTEDKSISVWEVAVRIAFTLQDVGAQQASDWVAAASSRVDLEAVKELSYLLYSICEKKGWADSAMLFNGLGTSWSDLTSSARKSGGSRSAQGELDLHASE